MELLMHSLIRNKPFLALFGTQFLGAFCDNFFRAALVTLITYSLKDYSEIETSFLVTSAFGLFTLPFFLFSPIAGQVADLYDKSIIIQWVKGSEILIVSLSSYGFIYKDPYLLLIGLFCMTIPSAFFGPAKYGLLPKILSKDELLSGNGYIEAGSFFAVMLGTLCGAVMIQWKISLSFLSFQLIFLSLIGFLISLYLPPRPKSHPHFKIRLSWSAEIGHLIGFVKNDKQVLQSLMCISWFWLIENVLLTQLPDFSVKVLHATENIFIFFLLLFTVGHGLGASLCGWMFKGKIKASYVPLFALIMVPLLLDIADFRFPLSSTPLSFMIFINSIQGLRLATDFFCFAFIGGVYIVLLYTFIQVHVASEHRSQVMAFSNILNAGFIVVSSLLSFCLLSLNVPLSSLLLIITGGQLIITIFVAKMLLKK